MVYRPKIVICSDPENCEEPHSESFGFEHGESYDIDDHHSNECECDGCMQYAYLFLK